MTTTRRSFTERIERILQTWGTETSGLPGKDAWATLAECPEDQAITLVNFFKMRERASYPNGVSTADGDVSGQEAFNRYASVSMPSLEKVGGKFLLVAPFAKTFIGIAEDWDLVAIGSYPNPNALLSLFELDAYRRAYPHRTAACSNQKVSLCLG